MTILAKWSGDGATASTALTTTTGYGTSDTHFDTVLITSPATVKVSGSSDFSLYTPRLELFPNGVATGNNPVHWFWQAALGTGPFPQHAVRFYIELADHPTGNAQIFSVRASDSAFIWWLDITAPGVLRLRNVGGTALALSAQPLPMNQTLRVEGTYNDGNIVVRVYRGDSIVALETLVGSVGSGLSPAQVRWGAPNNANVIPHMYFDEMAFANTSDLIGPPWISTPPFTLWDGSREIPADLYGLWDGTALQYVNDAEIAP